MFIHIASTAESVCLLEFSFLKITSWTINWIGGEMEIETSPISRDVFLGKTPPSKRVQWDAVPKKKQDKIMVIINNIKKPTPIRVRAVTATKS